MNSDEWLRSKKGKEFMSFKERKSVLENIKGVDEVISFEDDDLGSCINALEKIKKNIQMIIFYFVMVEIGKRQIFLKCQLRE